MVDSSLTKPTLWLFIVILKPGVFSSPALQHKHAAYLSQVILHQWPTLHEMQLAKATLPQLPLS